MTESTDERRKRRRALLDDFLERPIADVAGPLLGAPLRDADAVPAGARIGPYRVIRELGRGGMGVVCLAESSDSGTVALKVIRRALDTDSTMVERFRRERTILATLNHPGIARLLGDGVTDDGRPWIAMEYVDGVPINGYAAMTGIDTRHRLALFVAVCDAVEHAHAHGIVHRDIKPSNILVRKDGTTSLMDFGIAKPESPTGFGAWLTRTGQGRLTREYASPEQLRGRRATPASDVYSLGVLLFVLLTGRHPHAARRVEGARSLLRRLHLAPPSLGAAFPPELEAIVARAMRRSPRRRFASAGQLGSEIRKGLGMGLGVGAGLMGSG